MLWKLSEVDAAVSSLGLIAAPSGQEATPQQLAPLLPALQGLQLGQELVLERLQVQGPRLLSPVPGHAAGLPGWAQALRAALARPGHCMGKRGATSLAARAAVKRPAARHLDMLCVQLGPLKYCA